MKLHDTERTERNHISKMEDVEIEEVTHRKS
jgi:hypothetical protein